MSLTLLSRGHISVTTESEGGSARGAMHMSDFNLVELLGFGGTGFAASLAVLGLFWKADDAFSDEFRDSLSNKLRRMKIETRQVNWPYSFSLIFDRIFGHDHLSRKCFGRSCIASFLAILLLLALNWSLHPNDFWNFSLTTVWQVLVISICLNFLPDYLSLLETRWIIGVAMRHDSPFVKIILIAVDLVMTVIIFFVFGSTLTFFAFVLLSYFGAIPESIDFSLDGYLTVTMSVYRNIEQGGLYLQAAGGQAPSMGVYFYSTLFTSVWVWLFVAGWFVVRNGARFQKGLAVLQFTLPIKTKPMRSIGEVAAIVTALAFVVLGILGFDFEPTRESTVGLLVQRRP